MAYAQLLDFQVSDERSVRIILLPNANYRNLNMLITAQVHCRDENGTLRRVQVIVWFRF